MRGSGFSSSSSGTWDNLGSVSSPSRWPLPHLPSRSHRARNRSDGPASQPLRQWFPARPLCHQGTLAVSAGVFGHHTGRGTTGIQQAEARDAAQHPSRPRTPLAPRSVMPDMRVLAYPARHHSAQTDSPGKTATWLRVLAQAPGASLHT